MYTCMAAYVCSLRTTSSKRMGMHLRGCRPKPSNQNLKRKPRGKAGNRKEEGRGAGVAAVKRAGEGRKELQQAEYRNLEGRHEKSGRRERGKPESESGKAHRGSRCAAKPGREGKEKQRLSSQNPKMKRTKES